MNAARLFCLVALLLWGFGCRQTNKTVSPHHSEVINYEQLDLEKGRTIVQTVCNSCHDPSASQTDRIAPPLEVVKRNYIAVAPTEKEFIIKMTDFILSPSEEEAKLHEDVEEFGLMDPLGYSKSEVQSVALYIYRTELERPDWIDEEEPKREK